MAPELNKTVEIDGLAELTRDLGSLKDLKDKLYWPIHDAMSESVQQIEVQAKENLTQNGWVAFGHLRASLGSLVELTETEIRGRIGTNLGKAKNRKLVGYAPAVEFGSRPHWVPLQPLIEWVKVKRMTGVYSLKTHRRMGPKLLQAYQDEELAQRIRLKIARRGTRAHPFFFPAVDALTEETYRLFEKATDQVVDQFNQS